MDAFADIFFFFFFFENILIYFRKLSAEIEILVTKLADFTRFWQN